MFSMAVSVFLTVANAFLTSYAMKDVVELSSLLLLFKVGNGKGELVVGLLRMKTVTVVRSCLRVTVPQQLG